MTWTGPNIESLMGDLDATTMAALGDSVRYRPRDGGWADLRAYVDYGEALRSLETGQVIEQDIAVQILKADVPVKPVNACRITLDRLPGMTFRPMNVRSDQSGTHWVFEVALIDG